MRQPSYYLNHVTVNLFFFASSPGARRLNKGTWGRDSRLFGYIMAGSENLLHSGDYGVWTDVLRIPMDGMDGSGWENDGSWDDLGRITEAYKDLPKEDKPRNFDEKMNLWVRKVCSAK